MSCFVATGVSCDLVQSPRRDLFEIHVSIAPSDPATLNAFLIICAQHRWKAIVIDVDPPVPQQPMTCSRVTGSFADAYQVAQAVCAQLEQAGFVVTRVKIEAAPWNSHVPQRDEEWLHQDATAYFEYHAKLHLPATGWQATLAPLCAAFQGHVSRNARRHHADGSIERFVTIRATTCGFATFQQHTQRFAHAVQSSGFTVLGTVTEYCIYDSNQTLDAYWAVPAALHAARDAKETPDDTTAPSSSHGVVAPRERASIPLTAAAER